MPFGAGPRLCIGNNFAMMEMQLILSMFAKRYRFEVVKDQKIEVQPLITLRPRNGIKVKIHKR
jgi:cytochrome P450